MRSTTNVLTRVVRYPMASCMAAASPVPLHNWVLELKTGKAVAPDEGEAKIWPVKVEDGTGLSGDRG